jgi:DNA-binding MarR family transcriptional regulator
MENQSMGKKILTKKKDHTLPHKPEIKTYEMQNDLLGIIEKFSRKLYVLRSSGDMGQRRIAHILAAADSMSQLEIQNLLGIKSGSMSEIITKMEKKGYIIRLKDVNDKRKIVLKITESGRKWDNNVQKIMLHNEDRQRWFSVLSSSEREKLQEMLSRLIASWDDSKSV